MICYDALPIVGTVKAVPWLLARQGWLAEVRFCFEVHSVGIAGHLLSHRAALIQPGSALRKQVVIGNVFRIRVVLRFDGHLQGNGCVIERL